MEEDSKSTSCRVCLSNDHQLGPIHSIFDESQLADKINYVSLIDIKEGDGFPDQICSTCLLELNNAYNFKQKCIKSNEILHTALSSDVLEQHLEIHIKGEPDEYEYDYLDEDEKTISEYIKQINNSEPIKSEPFNEVPVRKSRMIDLKLICDDCGGSFKSKCKLKVHWKRVHLKERLICNICKRQFTTYKAYNSHKKRNLRSCATAGKVNIEGQGRSRTFHCRNCNYKTQRIKDIESHIVIHTGDRPYMCSYCSKAFTQLSSLHAHQEMRHNVNLKEGTCQFCGKFIQGRSKFYRHLKLHRPAEIECKICNKLLKTKTTFNQHMLRHTGVKNYYCEICSSKFFTSSELYNHKAKVHIKSKVHVCSLCGFKSHNKCRIVKHKSLHNNDNVACNVCGKFVDNSEQLVLHKKRHFERNFKCEQCQQKYFSKKNLLSHVRNVHKTKMLVNSKSC